MAKTDIGEFLASLRKSKGYTQQEAADLLGVSNKTVSNWETGASCPDISMLPALAELYGVTCDEIVRGKRILAAEDEKTAEIKREKAMARLLNKHKTDLTAVCWVCAALTAFGVILTLAIGCAALESMLGFFIGLIPLAASVVTGAVATRRIRFALGEEDYAYAGAAKLSASVSKSMFLIACANVAAFGFIFPHVLIPVHFGLNFPYALAYGACGALVGLAADFLIAYPIRLHMLRSKNETEPLSAQSPETAEMIKREKARGLALSRWTYKHILLLFGIPLLIFFAATCVLAVATANHAEPVYSVTTHYFSSREELVGYAQESELFSSYGHTLVREADTQTDGLAADEAVYLFPSFPEEWRAHYRCENADGGVLVTVYRYDVAESVGGAQESFSFYALNPDLQGGITEISAGELSFSVSASAGGDAEVAADEVIGDEDIVVRSYSIMYDPTLPEQAAMRRAHNVTVALNAALFAASGGYAVSLAVCIPVYVKKHKRYKAFLNNTQSREAADAQSDGISAEPK